MQIGDTELTCQEIADELSTLDVEAMRKFGKQSGETGKNIALGITGAFFIVPLFFMDFAEA